MHWFRLSSAFTQKRNLEPGRVIVEFAYPQQALEKLLALAMAISNDFDRFERQIQSS